jgi:hypothetical protein
MSCPATRAQGRWAPARRTLSAGPLVLLVLAALVSDGVADEIGEPSVTEPTAYALEGRSRFEMRLGAADLSVRDNEVTNALDVTGGAFSLGVLHWMSESFAFEISLGATNVGVRSRETPFGDKVDADGFGGVLAGGRFYLPVPVAFRPHVGLAVGPLTEYRVHDRPWETEVILQTTKLGMRLEAGVDFLVGRHFVIGVHGGTTTRHGYGPQHDFGINLGWNFGGVAQRARS